MRKEMFEKRLMTIGEKSKSLAFMFTKSKEKALDLYQDTCLKALKNRGKYKEDSNFQGWINTIMRNIFINNYRATVRKRAILLYVPDIYNLGNSSGGEYSFVDEFIEIAELKKIIEELPKNIKRIFHLRFEGYKYKEISEKLHMPIGSIKSTIFYNRKRIKEEINKKMQYNYII